MGRVREAAPLVTPLIAAFSSDPKLLDRVTVLVTEHFGCLAAISERYHFTETDYYAQAMGPALEKQLFVLHDLQPADCLPHLKIQTNELEDQIAREGRYLAQRPLNLDPGYIELGKLVLASTKDHAHRLYLGRGIFGEITLQFRGGAWRELPWTYPDFRRPEVQAFLVEAREIHRRRLARAAPPYPAPRG